MGSKSQSIGASQPIPLPLKVGGAFIAIALTLIVFPVLELIRNGWMAPVAISWRLGAVLCAAALLGAFATVRRDQRGGISQVIALGLAVVLVLLSRVLPSEALIQTEQFWVFGWALLALACALVLRRTVAH